jgi:hypothetical protein
LSGGNDNDDLYGENGNDVLWGAFWDSPLETGNPNDSLQGGSGSDTLYGGIGDDTLLGAVLGTYSYQDGLNFLHGEAGADKLYGGVWGSTDYLMDEQPSEDARVIFGNSRSTSFDGTSYPTKDWSADDIQRLDHALAVLHREARGTKLLKLASGGNMSFERFGGTGRGWNDGRRIALTDAQFGGSDNWLLGYVLHEIGHNWNGPQIGATRWNDFLAQSGWQPHNNGGGSLFPPAGYVTNGDGTWDYRANAAFASNYAKGHPNDDFAESFSAYFMMRAGWGFYNGAGASAIPAKIALIDQWVRSL